MEMGYRVPEFRGVAFSTIRDDKLDSGTGTGMECCWLSSTVVILGLVAW